MEDFTDDNGQKLINVHDAARCKGQYCCIHNPSSHHMAKWRRNWRDDRKMMERICPHGVGHPDPDDAAYRATLGDNNNVHGCDGCCVQAERSIGKISAEDLANMAAGTWIPPIKKLQEGPTFVELYDHHSRETEILYAIISELAMRLKETK